MHAMSDLFLTHTEFIKPILKISSNDKVQILTQMLPNSWMTINQNGSSLATKGI
jgi:hypothetical protein